MNNHSFRCGKRIVVTGMAGAGKSTFSKALAEKTNLPLIHLDLYLWNPGWVRVSLEQLLETQKELMAEDSWIIDSNDVDPELLLAHADTLVVIATPWWICSWRAFIRGLRRVPGSQLPEGCEESFVQRILDEWGIVWRNFRNRNRVLENDLMLAQKCDPHLLVYFLTAKSDLAEFVDAQ